MGELETNTKSSAEIYFDDAQVAVITLKSWARRPGIKEIDEFAIDVRDELLGLAARRAWDLREWHDTRDDKAVAASWDRLASLFQVDNRSKIRRVVLTRSDQLHAVPTEWKGDARSYIHAPHLAQRLDVSDAVFGSSIRRAMELTVS